MSSFDSNGNYNKTNWKTGDKITADKLNKIEESLEIINNNDIERHKETDGRLDALEEQNEVIEEELNNKATKDEVHERLDVVENCIYLEQFPKMEGETDDTERFQRAINYSGETGKKLIINGGVTTISSPIVVNKYINIEGQNGNFLNLWNGEMNFPKIHYIGTGNFLSIDCEDIETNTNAPSGSVIKNIWIEGSGGGYCAIVVNRNATSATSMRGITLDNVQITDFVNGYGVILRHTYGNKIINCSFQKNAINAKIEHCYATDIISTTAEDCLINYIFSRSPQVNIIGGVVEGARETNSRYTMPTDVNIWDGWSPGNGEQTTIIHERNTPEDYGGTGIINNASSVYCTNVYFEYQKHHFVCGLESRTTIVSCTVDVSSPHNDTFVNIGHGILNIDNLYIMGDNIRESLVFAERSWSHIRMNNIDKGIMSIPEDILFNNYTNCKYKYESATKKIIEEINCDNLTATNITTNKISTNNVYLRFDVGDYSIFASHEQIYPLKTNTYDIGDIDTRFKDGYFSGVLRAKSFIFNTNQTRPSNPVFGQMIIESGSGKIIYWDGANWIDCMGNEV